MTLSELSKIKIVTDAAPTLERHFIDLLVHHAANSRNSDLSDLAECRVYARIVRDLRSIQSGNIPAMRTPRMKPLHRFENESKETKPQSK